MGSDTVIHRIDSDLYLIRVIDTKTKFFEGVWHIPEGVVYNSYVYLTAEGAIVFDTVKQPFHNEYFDALRQVVSLGDIKYVVAHHLEPDHGGLIRQLVDRSKSVVLGHPLAGRMLKSLYGYTGPFQPVGDGYEVAVGGGRVKFIHTPWLHWPETIMSYIESRRALLTCDAFGSYGSFTMAFYDELGEDERTQYMRYALKYFANIIGNFRTWVSKNVDKLASTGLELNYILPSHGVAIRGPHVVDFIDLYLKWSRGDPVRGKATVLYTSMYRFVEKVAQRLSEELMHKGLKLVVHSFNDVEQGQISEVLADAYSSELILIATSTYEGDVFPIAKYVVELIARKTPVERKKIIVATLYGWGPRVGSTIRDIMARYGARDVFLVESEVGELEKLVNTSLELALSLTSKDV